MSGKAHCPELERATSRHMLAVPTALLGGDCSSHHGLGLPLGSVDLRQTDLFIGTLRREYPGASPGQGSVPDPSLTAPVS